jgi:protein-disulfide isomerase
MLARLKSNRVPIAAAVAGLLIGGGAVALAGGGKGAGASAGDERIAQLVKETILENPEILPQAMERLEQKQAGAAIDANREEIETPFGSAWAGAEDGDVVLVEFFDYACGYCRASNPVIDRLLAEDRKLKVVWREWPVLGPDSLAAAEVSLAAAAQGKFRPFYQALFDQGRPQPGAVAAARRQLGIGAGPSRAVLQAELEKNHRLATALRATGTPAFVVGDQVLHGAHGYEDLKAAIEEARARS